MYTDLLRPITPTALGCFRYVNKVINEKTMWTETLFLKLRQR